MHSISLWYTGCGHFLYFVLCLFFSISNKSSVISFFFYLIEQLNANDQRTRHVAILTNQKLGHINQSEIGT